MLEVLELTRLQESIVQEAPLYQVAYEWEGALEPEHMERALQEVVAAHPELRSVFRPLKNRIVQAQLKVRPVPLAVHDERESSAKEQQSKLEALAAADRGAMDIGVGPLLRVSLLLHAPTRATLVLTHHGLLFDPESRASFLQEWMTQYESLLVHQTPAVPRTRARFAAYLKWLARQDWMPAKEFWRSQAGVLSPTLALSNMRQGMGGSGRYLVTEQTLARETSDAIRALADRAQVTERAVAAAAWAQLVSLYAGEERVTYGWRATGRAVELADHAEGLGPFSQRFPLGTDVAGEQLLTEFLQGLENRIREIESAAHVPEAEALRDAEVADGVTLYDTSLSFRQPLTEEWRGFRVTERTEIVGPQEPPLQVCVWAGDVWKVRWSHAEEQLTAETVHRLQQQWELLLQSMAASESQTRLCDLPLVSEEERARLDSFNRSELPDPDLSRLAHQVIESQAAQTPDAIAVRCGDAKLTYAELNAEANRLAWHLRAQGFGREDVAGLFAERNIEMLIGILGVLKAGGAYVPLDTANPITRNRTVIENSRAKVVLTQSSFVEAADELVHELAASVVNLSEHAAWAEEPMTNPPFQNEPGDLANVFYTSGSTGLPKGAMVEHIGMLSHLYAKINLLHLNATSVVAQTASHCFDISVWQFLAPLMVGGVAVIYPNDVSMDPEALLDAVMQDGVSDLELVPAMMEMMWRAAEERGGVNLSSLRNMVATGEGLPTALSNRWRHRFPDVRMINAYGASETSDDFTHAVIDSLISEDRPFAQLGTVIPHHSVYVLDRFLRQVPIGSMGEICVTGVGVGRGYLHDPERTAKAFLCNPFEDGRGERLYRTGDLGYFLPDGTLMYISRVDFQVKVRGHRIELGEVEAALGKHEHVEQCVAIVRKDDVGQNRLLAYVVTSQATDSAVLRDHLKQWVPEYMIPEAVMSLERIPLTPNGKIDRKALPDPDQTVAGGNITKPRHAADAALVQIWEDVLHLTGLGIDQNFFELGGHSLKTIQVRARIKKQFGVDIPLHLLFEHQTIRELSELVGDAPLSSAGAEDAISIPKLPPADAYEMSHAQRRLFFLHRLDPDNVSYNMPALLELVGEVDHGALERAFGRILARHDVLRSTYEVVEGAYLQRVHPPQPLSIQVTDVSALEPEAREAALWAEIEAEMNTPFSLTAGPIFRARAFRLEPSRHWLLVHLHHIVADFWSWQVLTREFQAFYAAECTGQSEPLTTLPPLPVQYADYAVWQNERLAGGALQAAQAYWRETLGGELPVLDLPTDHPRPAVLGATGRQMSLPIEGELAAKLQALTLQGDATLFLVLLSAVGVLLSRLSGQSDLVIGTPEAGRNLLELEGMMGLFVNTMPLRFQVQAGESFLALLEKVKAAALRAYEHHEYPFDQLVEDLNPARDLSRTPIFAVMFQVLRDGEERFHDAAGLRMQPVDLEVTSTKFDLQIDFVERPGKMECLFTYRTDLYEQETVERWMHHLLRLLEQITAEPATPVDALPLLTEAEQQHVLTAWNETDVSNPSDLCLHELFEQQVERTPDAVALVCEGEQLTYRELNEKANRLAHFLRSQGVGPEVRVGLSAERSVEMLIAIYGILKAGGAYVPLDPHHPEKRMAEVLEDAGLAMILTQSRWEGLFAACDLPLWTLDGESLPWTLEQEGVEENPVRLCTSENLVYMLYTSGSTGKPKGVMNEHLALVNLLLWMREQYGLTAEDRVMLKTAYTFDVSIWELFLPLISGAALVIAQPDGHRDPAYVKALIEQERISFAVFVPSALQVFVEQPGLESITGLKYVLCIGEALSVELQERFFQTFPHTELHNLYGPTEAAVNVTFWNCPRGDQRRYVPLGAPIANAKLYVLDAHQQPVPLGVTGELYIGGTPVARGYHNRAELTAERFLSDPFGPPSARMYRTGDLVRRHREGTLEYLGRADDQVKLRGFRIELGDIEAALLNAPGVREAAVLLQREEGDAALVAYVVTDADVAGGASALRESLLGQLPDYMVPARYVFLESFPLLQNDKLDRKALRALDPGVGENGTGGSEYMPPRSTRERQMALVFENILGVCPIGVQDDFFARGGHSLKALSLVGAVQETFGVTLPLVQVYQKPTVAGLCELLESSDGEQGQRALAPLRDGVLLIQAGDGSETPLFLVHGQGGGISSFFLLAQALGAQATVYGVQAFGYESDVEPLTSIAEMADRYAAEIRNLVADGSCRVAGWSFGGTVAFEVARRLEQQGVGVEWVGLLDAHPMDLPDDPRVRQAWTEEEVLRFALVDLGLPSVALDGLGGQEAFEYVAKQLVLAGRVPRGLPEASLRAKVNTMAAHGTAMAFYRYEGSIRADLHLFCVSQTSSHGHSLVEPEEWRLRTAGTLWVHSVLGDHNSMLESNHVQSLANKLQELHMVRKGC